VWAALPAFYEVKVGFPRSWITVGLAALGFLLTLFAWFDTFNIDFSIWALLGVLVAAVILVFAVLTLIPELRNRRPLPGALSSAAQWANRPAPDLGSPSQSSGPGAYGQPAPPHTQPPHSPPPAPGPSSSYGSQGGTPPAADPPPAGGPSAPGEGAAPPDRPGT
jgi:hypothetical protein